MFTVEKQATGGNDPPELLHEGVLAKCEWEDYLPQYLNLVYILPLRCERLKKIIVEQLYKGIGKKDRTLPEVGLGIGCVSTHKKKTNFKSLMGKAPFSLPGQGQANQDAMMR